MLFNSIVFIIFFTLFFLLYWTWCGRSLRSQNVLLLLGSALFYGWWDWRFLLLLYFTVTTTYFTALQAGKGRAKLWTGANIVVNLLVLCLFKYFNFFSENLMSLIRAFGFEPGWFTIDVLLPVGISFYTFQAISYSVDVYRGRIAAERDYLDFAVFLSFFPQLVAGPIEKASDLLPQIKTPRTFDYGRVVSGMRQALWGLVKKVVIADACAPDVNYYFSEGGFESASSLKMAYVVILFSVQIYCDFSGYCDIARGSARCLGINLMQNFCNPYFSVSIKEFWRRWNASLMLWFRDYVYIPLGGSRRGRLHTYYNTFIVFLLSGLWHGAAWNFVLWGVYLGVMSVLYAIYRRWRERQAVRTNGSCTYAPAVMLTCLTMVYGWLLFRSDSLHFAVEASVRALPALAGIFLTVALALYLWRLATCHCRRIAAAVLTVVALSGYICVFCLDPVRAVYYYLPLFITLMFVVEWRYRHADFTLETMPRNPVLRYGAYYLMITLLLVSCAEDVPFIYFQF